MMNKTMLAVVYRGKGDIRLEERPVPRLLEPGDAIVKVEASSICASDLHIHNGAVPRAREGIILGHEFAGEIVQVGDGVKCYKVGDRVAANVESFCGECFYCKLNTRPLLTHRMPLEQIMEAYELFAHRPDSCIKVCITP